MPKQNEILTRASQLAMACRAADSLKRYSHVGDINWTFHNEAGADMRNWHFWQDENGRDIGLLHIGGTTLYIVAHPQADPSLENEIRQWGRNQLRQRAVDNGQTSYKVSEDVADNESERTTQLLAEGYSRDDTLFSVIMRRDLSVPIAPVQLPNRFHVRSVADESEVEMRGKLHRASFLPYSSESDEVAIANHRRVMGTPCYEFGLDLMIVDENGRPAAGCICWLDTINKVGLFEPVGTHPDFRRMGLATQLMQAGLHRLKERGMEIAELGAMHPGENCQSPVEFTSSRHVFYNVGFRITHRHFWHEKSYSVDE